MKTTPWYTSAVRWSGRSWTFLATSLMVTFGLSSNWLMASDVEDAAAEEVNPREEMAALGSSLKAAVISGEMSEEDARLIWEAAVAEIKGQSEEAQKKDDNPENLSTSAEPKAYIGRLIPPDPTHPTRLMEPEFLSRDAFFLIDRLDLDRQRAVIVEMIIRDYLDAFELMAEPLLEAIQRYEDDETRRALQEQIARLDMALENNSDFESARSVMEERVRGYATESVERDPKSQELDGDSRAQIASKRAQEWNRELGDGLEHMNERMSTLRNRMQARLDDVEQPNEVVTAKDLVRMAKDLRNQRANLKADVHEMLTVVLVIDDVEQEQAELDDALSELQIKHGLRHARMGGEFINPWSVLIETWPGQEPAPVAQAALEEHKPLLAHSIDLRSQAAIDRELIGLELIKTRDELVSEYGNEENVGIEKWLEVLEPFANSWDKQVETSIAYRDHILNLVEHTSLVIGEEDPEAAARYRDIAMRRGFAPEMRTRWCERSLKAALELKDLDDETWLILLDLETHMKAQLAAVRDKAIAKRLQRDPELARKPVLGLWGLDDSKEDIYIREDWMGQEFEAHLALNEDVESSLRSILSPEQFETLPRRRAANRDNDKGGQGKDNKGRDRRAKAGSDKSSSGKGGSGKGG